MNVCSLNFYHGKRTWSLSYTCAYAETCFKVNTLKDQGNKAFAAKDYDKAIALFSDAIKLDPSNHVLYSNRSAAHAGNREWEAALEDAEAVCALQLFYTL